MVLPLRGWRWAFSTCETLKISKGQWLINELILWMFWLCCESIVTKLISTCPREIYKRPSLSVQEGKVWQKGSKSDQSLNFFDSMNQKFISKIKFVKKTKRKFSRKCLKFKGEKVFFRRKLSWKFNTNLEIISGLMSIRLYHNKICMKKTFWSIFVELVLDGGVLK